MPPPNLAATIYASLIENLELLQQLHAEGRIMMTPDRFNAEWRDPTVAFDVAAKALEWATEAVKWMIVT